MSNKSKSLFLCYFDELIKTDCIIRFFDELQDEIVCFIVKKEILKFFHQSVLILAAKFTIKNLKIF